MYRLGSTAARLKLKGIDGDLHKRWSMWFNSTVSGEPYQVLTCNYTTLETESSSRVLHRCCTVENYLSTLIPVMVYEKLIQNGETPMLECTFV